MYKLATRALHVLDPETAHVTTIKLLKAGLGPASSLQTPELAVNIAFDGGVLHIPNCVGLAAGFDKNAEVPVAMARAGFGFVECGTVTPLPQAGNPRPRLFRLTEDEAVINRMGFNNGGLEAYARNLESVRGRAVVGLNIGANKDSADRMADYVTGLKRLWGLGSYFTINIGRSHLDDLLSQLAAARAELVAATGQNMPVFLKIAPDLSDAEIEDTVAPAIDHGLNGLIVSNTTLSRDGLRSPLAKEAGGMSGKPLFDLATRALKVAAEASAGRLVLIGAGGVSSGGDAYAKIRAGASLVQLYSALVYKGPGLVDDIRRDLVLRLKADGFRTVSEAVGV
ncbi:MAG: quinone-dependent dihydroorotate dehydrogenase [Asticcacaulis sp.]|nr:quinone-dependent dihydroorotate dehydrogenase [Asticcacaulis sp.]